MPPRFVSPVKGRGAWKMKGGGRKWRGKKRWTRSEGEERRKKIEQERKRSGRGKEEQMQSAERWRGGCR